MKVAEISYESNISEFIDYNGVKKVLKDIKLTLDEIDESVLTILDNEINNGGLDLYAANIDGTPIFHNKAVELEQEVRAIHTDCSTQIESLDKQAKDHRRVELTTYIEKLEEKISQLEEENRQLQAIADSEYKRWEELGGGKTAEGSAAYNTYYSNTSKIKENSKKLNGGWWSAYNGGLYSRLIDAENALSELG